MTNEHREKALNIGLLWLRVTMGLAMASHGYMKIFGGQITMLQEGLVKMNIPMPTVSAWLAALSEFAGGLLIALGCGTRVAAFFVAFTMGVAFFVAHGQDPFHMKLAPYLYGIIAIAFILTGAGRYSLDNFCCKRRSPE